MNKWQTGIPTKGGWYWVHKEGLNFVEMAHVVMGMNTRLYIEDCEGYLTSLESSEIDAYIKIEKPEWSEE